MGQVDGHRITGWDVGGAHLKAAVIEDGSVSDVVQLPSLIWTDLEDLRAALGKAIAAFGEAPVHAVTMTGELAEYFGSRAEGVRRLSDLMATELRGKDVRIFAGRKGFVSPQEADAHVEDIASANWFGTASLVGKTHADAILIDIGSSTCDVIPVVGGTVAATGYSDAERLSSGELIYTGVVRTPVMAISDKVPFDGALQSLMAERFAVMADVYRILGVLPEGADLFPAVDDREKDVLGSIARLARMLGRDSSDHEEWQWVSLARFLADVQMRAIEQSVFRIQSRFAFSAHAPIIGAGAGRFVVAEIARRLNVPYVDFADLVKGAENCREKIATCAPAVAVAMLAGAR